MELRIELKTPFVLNPMFLSFKALGMTDSVARRNKNMSLGKEEHTIQLYSWSKIVKILFYWIIYVFVHFEFYIFFR